MDHNSRKECSVDDLPKDVTRNILDNLKSIVADNPHVPPGMIVAAFTVGVIDACAQLLAVGDDDTREKAIAVLVLETAEYGGKMDGMVAKAKAAEAINKAAAD
jgi:hypothetical protein